jgi:SAM-dependent methyltransferase
LAENACHVCRGAVEPLSAYSSLGRVTSDCKPWPRGGRLGACRSCGTIQKALDAAWWTEAEQIYRDYTIYFQSDGAEQAVFTPGSGEPSARSVRLLDKVAANVALPGSGRLLDVGCGNGALLRAFGKVNPGWRLAGFELSDKYRTVVEQIPGVERLYTGGLGDIPGAFDVITLIHALEHIHEPVAFLSQLRQRIVPDGLLLVEVPNVAANPFDVLVADHASHFTPVTATGVLQRAGFDVLQAATDWIPKELTLVARPLQGAAVAGGTVAQESGLELASQAADWLHRVVSAARTASAGDRDRFGIFGTSINATWLATELDGGVGFFVDEDPNRRGRQFMGRPILHPDQVTGPANVFMLLVPALAADVSRRLEARGVRFTCHEPPPLGSSARRDVAFTSAQEIR